jgi:hypothetical protein
MLPNADNPNPIQTTAPVLSGPAGGVIYMNAIVNITNWATAYSLSTSIPLVYVQVHTTNGAIVVANQSISCVNGVINIPVATLIAGTTYVVSVKVQEITRLVSTIVTTNITKQYATFQYWRMRNITTVGGGTNYIQLSDLRFYTASAGTGTPYPANMTSATAPTPYVVTSSFYYNATYADWLAFNSIPSDLWWTLGQPNPTQWIQINMGSQRTIASLIYRTGPSIGSQIKSFDMVGSNTGSFTGEETLIAQVYNADSLTSTSYTIG